MKGIFEKIAKIFSEKEDKIDNIDLICRNAKGELSTYCSKEYTYKL